MNTVYGYCRISKPTQSMDRQIRNIQAAYPDIKKANIFKEAYTGTRMQGREALDNLLKKVDKGDTIVFDSVSRMSRNAAEGCALYEELYNKGVELVFLKEPHVNTNVYRSALEKAQENYTIVNTGDKPTDNFIKAIFDALKNFQMDLAKKQIEIAFNQAQKEVEDLHQRTKEGIETARLNGKQIGRKEGVKIETPKAKKAKRYISEYAMDFGGNLKDIDVMKMIRGDKEIGNISKPSYYRYKAELKAAM